MACDAQTLENGIAAQGYGKLSDFDLLVCLTYALANKAGLTATQAINGAATQGYGKLSEGDLAETFKTKLCH